MPVEQKMQDAVEFFKKKNKDRGQSFTKAGAIFKAYLPDGVILRSEEDFNAFCSLVQVVDCVTRVITLFGKENINFESIEDSAKDCGIYSFILMECLEIMKNKNVNHIIDHDRELQGKRQFDIDIAKRVCGYSGVFAEYNDAREIAISGDSQDYVDSINDMDFIPVGDYPDNFARRHENEIGYNKRLVLIYYHG